jgi:type VI secretion system protein ImpC
VGLWTFSPTVEDAAMLGRLGRLARAAGAAFLAAASPRLAARDGFAEGSASGTGDEAEEALWQALRSMPGAEWIGLALPRILLRLPYGAATEPTEEFAFEEDEAAEHGHEALLWGNPAVACAILLAQSFAQDGWEMTPGSVKDLDDLPLYVREADGAKTLTPCAETLLTDAQTESILDRGLMPLVSRRESDSVRVARFQSIRDPLTPLSGPWASS